MMGRKLARSFYERSASEVAPDLLGMHLVRVRAGGMVQVGRIVEAEAYEGPHDLAAHSAHGRRTPRTEVMFGEPGRAYVYLIYGIHHCLNVVTAPRDVPHAVLIRALEPISGVEHRTQGPGLLCTALAIDRTLNGADLQGNVLWIERPQASDFTAPRIETSARVGILYAGRWVKKKWRFSDANSKHVSKLRISRPPE